MDTLKAQIAGRNDGMLSTYRSSNQSFKVMMEYKVRIEGNTVTRDGEPMFAIHRRHSAKKVQGCYRELTPMLEYIGRRLRKQRGKNLLSGNSSVLRQRASLSGKRRLSRSPTMSVWSDAYEV